MPSYATSSQTQFMANVMARLRNANQVSQSNNLSVITSKGATPSGSHSSMYVDPHRTFGGEQIGNRHVDQNLWTSNIGDGFITDQNARNVVKGLLMVPGTIKDVGDSVLYGVTKVGEAIVDGLIGLIGWVGSWFGASDQWAKDAISYDASRWIVENINISPTDVFARFALGETLAEQSALNELPKDFQDTTRNVLEVAGEIAPSVILAIFTGGSSLAVQAGAQAALAGATAFGRSVESGVKEGSELGESIGYGAMKGAGSAALSALSMGIGGSVASKGGSTLVDKAANKVFEKTGSLALRTVTKAGLRGASAYLEGQISTLVDPLERQITIDNEAIEKAYGSSDRVMATLKESATNGLKAAAIRATFTAVQEGVGVVKAGGKEKYAENIFAQMEMDKNPELRNSIKEIKEYTDNRSRICKELAKGKITEEQFVAKMDALDHDFETAMATYEVHLDNYAKQAGGDVKALGEVETGKYAQAKLNAKNNVYEYAKGVGTNAEVGRWVTDQASKTFKEGGNFQTFKTKMTMKDMGEIKVGGETVKPNGFLTVETGENNQVNIPITDSGDGNVALVRASIELNALVMASANKADIGVTNVQLPSRFTPTIKGLTELTGNKPFTIETKALNAVIKENPNYSPKDIVNALKTLPNANMISELKNNQVTITSRTFGENGNATYNNFVVDVKQNRVRSMVIADKADETVFTYKPDEYSGGVRIVREKAEIYKGFANSMRDFTTKVKTTTDFVKHFKNEMNNLIKGVDTKNRVKLVDSTTKIGRYAFAKISTAKDLDSATNDIMKVIGETKLIISGEEFSISDIIGEEGLAKIKDDFKTAIQKDAQISMRNANRQEISNLRGENAALNRSLKTANRIQKVYAETLKELKNKLSTELKERSEVGSATNVFTNLNHKTRAKIRTDLKYDEDAIKHNTMSLMLKPITNVHTSGGKLSSRGFWENIQEFKDNYTAEKITSARLPYDENFRQEMLYLEQIMPQPKRTSKGWQYPSMDSASVRQMTKILRMATTLEDKARHFDVENAPTAKSIMLSMDKVDGYMDTSIYQKIMQSVASPIANERTFLHIAFRNNPTINKMVDDSLSSFLQAQEYVDEKCEAIAQFKKETKVGKVLGKKVDYKGVKLTQEEMMYLDRMFRNKEIYSDLKRVGKLYKGETDLLSKGSLSELKKFVKENTLDNVKEYGSFLTKILNHELKEEYASWYNTKYGVDANTQKNYLFTARKGERSTVSDITGRVPPRFSNSITKVANNNPYEIVPMEQKVATYIKELSLQLKCDETLHRNLNILNVENGDTTIGQSLKSIFAKEGKQDKYVTRLINYFGDSAGVRKIGEGETNIFQKALDKITEAKIITTLSTPKTMSKQFASAFTSNVRPRYVGEGIVKAIAGDKTLKAEQDWAKENFPGYKFRMKGNTLLTSSLPSDTAVSKYVKTVGKYSMFGTKGADKLTIDALVRGLFLQVEADYGFKVGSPDNRNIAKELWLDLNAKQIGSTPAHKTTITRSTSGLIRFMFANYQGAINAQFSSSLDKFYTLSAYDRVKKDLVKYEAMNLDEKCANLKKEYEIALNFKQELERKIGENNIKIEKETDTAKIDEIKAENENLQSQVKEQETKAEEDLHNYQEEASKRDYRDNLRRENRRAQSYGGKKHTKVGIGINIALSTTLAATIMATIDQIWKWATHKETPKDFDVGKFFTDLSLNATVNVIPIINQLKSTFIDGYDLSNPSLTVMGDFTKMFTSIKDAFTNGKWEKALITSVETLASVSGVPLATLYDLGLGMTEYFDPETAIKMKNVYYNISTSKTTANFNEAIKNNDTDRANAYVKVIMQERVGEVSDKVAKELVRLYSQGQVNLPKNVASSYTDSKGKDIEYTKEQKEFLKNTYSKANNYVNKLIGSNGYKALTDEQKGAAINYIYSAYYEGGKTKAIKNYQGTKAGAVATTNINMSTIASSLATIRGIEATKKLSKKEQAIKYVNSLNCEVGMKYLILALAGYSLNDKAQKTLKSYLKNKGMKDEYVKLFQKEKGEK